MKYRLARGWFSLRYETPSCSSRWAGSEHVLFDLEGSISKFALRSGQSQFRVRSWTRLVSRYAIAHPPKQLDESSRLEPFERLYLYPVATYWRKTYCDFICPHLTHVTSPWPLIVSSTRIITGGMSGCDLEINWWLRSVYLKRESFSYFPIGV